MTRSDRKASLPDPLNAEQRRRNMQNIRQGDTRPEMILRRGLHGRGLRYRLHVRNLPGTPDIVFPARRAVIFVHGCFWHGHDCALFKLPASQPHFWATKISRNQERDRSAQLALDGLGWRILNVWECALRGRGRRTQEELLNKVTRWLGSGLRHGDLASVSSDCPSALVDLSNVQMPALGL